MSVYLEVHALETLLQDTSPEVRRATHRVSLHPRPCVLHHDHAIPVIRVCDGESPCGQRVEEGLFGVPVVLEGLVVVQVVTGQVGEDAPREGQPSYPVLCHAVAAHLHEGILASLVGHLSQQLVERDRVGGGALGGNGAPVDIVAHGAAQPAFVSHTPEHIVKHRGNGGLPVGAGHAHQFHPAAGIARAGGGQGAHGQLGVGIHQIGHSVARVLRQDLTGNRRGALGNSLSYVLMSVHLGAPQRHKQVTGLHPPRVYLHALHLSVALSHYAGGPAVNSQLVQFHLVPIYNI